MNPSPPLSLVFVGLSLSSSWGNGHATTYRALLKARNARGAVDFETTETQIICDENGRIEQIVPRVRNDAHRLIEEAMLAANVCAAEFIQQAEHPGLYRVHEGPTPEKKDLLRNYLKAIGVGLTITENPLPAEFQRIAEATRDGDQDANEQVGETQRCRVGGRGGRAREHRFLVGRPFARRILAHPIIPHLPCQVRMITVHAKPRRTAAGSTVGSVNTTIRRNCVITFARHENLPPELPD